MRILIWEVIIIYKWLDKNIDLSIKFSRYYMGVSFIIFLIFGSSEFASISERLVLSFGVLIGYLMFFNFGIIYLKMQKKIQKYSWEKVKKFLKFQSNFFIGGGTIGTLLFTLGGLTSLENLVFMLLAINITIGLVLGTIKAKQLYLTE